MTIELSTAAIGGLILAVLGWLLKTGYNNVMDRINGKVDRCAHEQCAKAKDEMNRLMLEEIRGLRSDFKDKSAIVIDAVQKPRKKK